MKACPHRAAAKAAGEKRYFTGKPCKRGHVAERLVCNRHCVVCDRDRMRMKRKDEAFVELERAYGREYRSQDHVKERDKENVAKNKAHVRQRINEWSKRKRKTDPEWRARQNRLAQKRYRNGGREKQIEYRSTEEFKQKRNSGIRRRYRNDPEFRMKKSMQDMLRRNLRMIDGEKLGSTCDNLKYSPLELKEHLERQFDKNMNWENYGSYWHIDHIIPISVMIQSGETDPAVCNALANLRPLKAEDNLSKSDKVEYLI